MFDRPLKVALLFSIGIHAIVLSPISSFVNRAQEKRETNIEVTYVALKEKIEEAKPLPEEAPEVSLKKELPAPSKTKDATRKKEQKKKKIISKKTEEILKKDEGQKQEDKKIFLAHTALDLNALSTHKGTSESINYLKAIRDKISMYVHRRYNAAMGDGEALLHFVLSVSGTVRSATILRDNLGDNKRLRNLCLDSVYHSSPFKPFPKDIDLKHAAFKINISFKRD
jgi:outer membrane biosynthesis protein TonB